MTDGVGVRCTVWGGSGSYAFMGQGLQAGSRGSFSVGVAFDFPDALDFTRPLQILIGNYHYNFLLGPGPMAVKACAAAVMPAGLSAVMASRWSLVRAFYRHATCTNAGAAAARRCSWTTAWTNVQHRLSCVPRP